MKITGLVLLLAILLLGACEYDVPLSSDHNIAIDPAILGTWVIVAEENGSTDDTIRIHRFSNTEYSIHYQEGNSSFYFRAYAVSIAGINAVQLELIGTNKQSIGMEEENRYHVALYTLLDDQIEVRMLNTELVDTDSTDPESLQAAFSAQKNNPELFNDPGLFRRAKS